MSYEIYDIDPQWIAHPAEKWLTACHKPGRGIQDPELRGILPVLYALFPQPGRPSNREVPVIIKNGEQIGEHAHEEYTLIYYVQVGDPQVAIIVDKEPLYPKPGQAVMLQPNTPHAVEKSQSTQTRLSIALRWLTPKLEDNIEPQPKKDNVWGF